MQKFPEFFELKARIEEKAKQIEDKDRHIEFLKKELESVG
jgi:phage regulator Rha-like protein